MRLIWLLHLLHQEAGDTPRMSKPRLARTDSSGDAAPAAVDRGTRRHQETKGHLARHGRSSEMKGRSDIVLTATDERRLAQLLQAKANELDRSTLELLEDELQRATIVDSSEIPGDVVTMNSVISFEDLETGQRLEITLVYPSATSGTEGRVSILAPIGSALLGLSVGDSIEWPVPGGRSRRLRVTAVHYQPEAEGQLHL
jgi:regulator of nucleoside diphosphate kinase